MIRKGIHLALSVAIGLLTAIIAASWAGSERQQACTPRPSQEGGRRRSRSTFPSPR